MIGFWNNAQAQDQGRMDGEQRDYRIREQQRRHANDIPLINTFILTLKDEHSNNGSPDSCSSWLGRWYVAWALSTISKDDRNRTDLFIFSVDHLLLIRFSHNPHLICHRLPMVVNKTRNELKIRVLSKYVQWTSVGGWRGGQSTATSRVIIMNSGMSMQKQSMLREHQCGAIGRQIATCWD